MTPARLTVRSPVGAPGGARAIPVELYPADPGAPAVVVLHEVWGVNDDLRAIARRFAANGYHAAVPDLYRGGHWARCMWRALVSFAAEGSAVDDVEAVVAAMEQRDEVGRVGVVGFCMGGGFAGLVGTRREVGAVGIFYGDAPRRDRLARRAAPTFAGYGGDDRLFASHAHRLARDLTDLGVPHDVKRYDGCGHSYMTGDGGHPILAGLLRPIMRVAYHPEAAEDSWARMLAFFDTHLRRDLP